MRKGTITYRKSTNRYYSESDDSLGRIEIRKQLDKYIQISSQRMQVFTNDLRDGGLSIAEWQEAMLAEIESSQVIGYALAHGGFDSVTPEVYSDIEVYVNSQIDYLQNFANQIYTGQQVLNGTATYRSSLYAHSARITYENERGVIEKDAGATEELNILGGADHCTECVYAASIGWTEIGTLIPVGYRQCGSRCQCSIVYRKGPDDELGSEEESF